MFNKTYNPIDPLLGILPLLGPPVRRSTRRYRWKPDGTSATGSITKVERRRRNRLKKMAMASKRKNRGK